MTAVSFLRPGAIAHSDLSVGCCPQAVEQDTEWTREDGYLNATAIASLAASLATSESSCQWSDYSRPNKIFLGKQRLHASA